MRAPSRAPWLPPGLANRGKVTDLSYIVIDELESGLCGLTITPWPTVDEYGRLRFDLTNATDVGTPVALLSAHLSAHRVPKRLAHRPPRMGDVFATTVREPPGNSIIDPASWMGEEVIDLTADARDLAKVAFFAAVTPLLRRKDDPEILELAPRSRMIVRRAKESPEA
jgi:hypothetical protein